MPIETAPSTPAFAELLGPIGLGEVAASPAALLERVDCKYIVPVETAERLARRLRDTHRLLTIGGRSSFRYRTVYYDTPDLASFREHLQGRRRRFKCRSRVCADSGEHWFEVKLKGPRAVPTSVAWRAIPRRPGPSRAPPSGSCARRSRTPTAARRRSSCGRASRWRTGAPPSWPPTSASG